MSRSRGRRVAVVDRSHRRWFGRGRTRALLTLGIIASLGAVGTGAYWTDTAIVLTGPISSGKMDMQLSKDGSNWDGVGLATAASASHITVSALTPGEAYAFPLYVRNVGDADFTYTATVTEGASPAWTYVDTPITVQLYAGAPNTTDTTYPVQQSCGGTAVTAAAVTVGTGNSTVITTARRLAKGTVDSQFCVLVTMVTSASNGDQGKTGQVRFDFSANQVTS